MSYTTMNIVLKNGDVVQYKEYGNSHGFAPYVWDALYDKYLKDPQKSYDCWLTGDHQKLWDLVEDKRIEEHIRFVHLSTMDHAIIEYGKLQDASTFYNAFLVEYWDDNRVCHLDEMVKDFIAISKEYSQEQCLGVCFYQTSLSDNNWYVYDSNNDDDEGRPYNINQDSKHWFVGDDLGRINSKLRA